MGPGLMPIRTTTTHRNIVSSQHATTVGQTNSHPCNPCPTPLHPPPTSTRNPDLGRGARARHRVVGGPHDARWRIDRVVLGHLLHPFDVLQAVRSGPGPLGRRHAVQRRQVVPVADHLLARCADRVAAVLGRPLVGPPAGVAATAPQQLPEEYSPAMLRAHEFLRQQGWQHDIRLRSNPYTLVHDCEGQTMFEHISQSPARATRLNDAMVAEDSLLAEIGLYPFAQALGPLAHPDTPTIIDVGGGRGHILKQLRTSLPDLPGRFILQDRASVLADNGPDMTAHAIEPMAHDFFQPQPVQGALVYYIRRVLHDWPDDEVRQILTHLAAAMDRETSRILITETIIPEVGATATNAYMDLTMMTFGGRERTAKHFAQLLDLAGLRLAHVWKASGVPMVVVEARLK
ncbi:S-adenosyl-L-methionine-dependent methyltransferase [Aspergillus heteromorphus CBS 117.55]|uniref:S-adenosyl-L-methionine-dependent methyltransferase n=1 Tax=Aspergillus heteromorphus CBS 117.55 TaxID=1448321 RepID=A0A317VM29_9EURO|nr:S-adenosyl-L-methionine-dependent methyltransferase [Aspergillus heteromorphus CBS 117.55]PWY74271.1 S-adenosyl-L-methionine-dependent methyltransferase [Aspergillus heteromorphus CBS 117.55]